MVDQTLLKDMAQTKLGDIAPELLTDILEVEAGAGTASQRLERFLAQIGNPYCFRVGKTPVRLSFQPCGATLDAKLRSYFLGLKHG